MNTNWSTSPSDPELQRLLEKARTYVMSPEEVFEQRVSFVYGMLGFKSTVTKEQVREHLLRLEGATPGTTGAPK